METFIVRLWLPADDEAEPTEPLHGVLERAGAAEPRPFRGSDQLLALLRAGLAGDPADRTTRETGA